MEIIIRRYKSIAGFSLIPLLLIFFSSGASVLFFIKSNILKSMDDFSGNEEVLPLVFMLFVMLPGSAAGLLSCISLFLSKYNHRTEWWHRGLNLRIAAWTSYIICLLCVIIFLGITLSKKL